MGDIVEFRRPGKLRFLGECADANVYEFVDKPVVKSSTNVLSKAASCQTCGCLKQRSRRKGCDCICHADPTD